MIRFTQHPGDLVYVPDRWSHRTLNQQIGTMGVTYEISPARAEDRRPMEPYHVDYVAMQEQWLREVEV